jgi:serine/threonine-protein kinase RsbW
MISSLTDYCPLEFPQVSQIVVNTDLRSLKQVLSWFEQFQRPSVPTFTWLQCQLALAEAFTNAVRHAHAGKQADTPIEIEIEMENGAIALKIWDRGNAFDLEKRLHRATKGVDVQAEGGRGLKLMKQMADYISYTRTADDRNCLFILKKYVPISEARCEIIPS